MIKRPIRILILDDHTLFREALFRMLDEGPRYSVVAHCAAVDEALSILADSALKGSPVDVVLLDYDLGIELGTGLLKGISALLPPPRVVLVTAGASPAALRAARSDGVVDVVFKNSAPEHLMQAIDGAASRGAPGSAAEAEIQASAAAADPETFIERPLTRRQSSVLAGILDGLTNREIAHRTHASESSVKATIQELFRRAGVRTRSQLVRVAIEKHSHDWIK